MAKAKGKSKASSSWSLDSDLADVAISTGEGEIRLLADGDGGGAMTKRKSTATVWVMEVVGGTVRVASGVDCVCIGTGRAGTTASIGRADAVRVGAQINEAVRCAERGKDCDGRWELRSGSAVVVVSRRGPRVLFSSVLSELPAETLDLTHDQARLLAWQLYEAAGVLDEE